MPFLPEDRGQLVDFTGELRAYLGCEVARFALETGRFSPITDPAGTTGKSTDVISMAKRLLRRLRG